MEKKYEVLKYGNIMVDSEISNNNGYTRVRLINYENRIYYHSMENGEVKNFYVLIENADKSKRN